MAKQDDAITCEHAESEPHDLVDEAGQSFFHGSLVPVWLDDLVEAIAGCMEADEPTGSLD